MVTQQLLGQKKNCFVKLPLYILYISVIYFYSINIINNLFLLQVVHNNSISKCSGKCLIAQSLLLFQFRLREII